MGSANFGLRLVILKKVDRKFGGGSYGRSRSWRALMKGGYDQNIFSIWIKFLNNKQWIKVSMYAGVLCLERGSCAGGLEYCDRRLRVKHVSGQLWSEARKALSDESSEADEREKDVCSRRKDGTLVPYTIRIRICHPKGKKALVSLDNARYLFWCLHLLVHNSKKKKNDIQP